MIFRINRGSRYLCDECNEVLWDGSPYVQVGKGESVVLCLSCAAKVGQLAKENRACPEVLDRRALQAAFARE